MAARGVLARAWIVATMTLPAGCSLFQQVREEPAPPAQQAEPRPAQVATPVPPPPPLPTVAPPARSTPAPTARPATPAPPRGKGAPVRS
ncbi:MAG: hypothetical protein FJZ01_10270 [Candidatus Sericytochromatia bacterium]|nr:hypothetical protein [Candidatus Tanganyikabacteria bacterium]